jgi:hypothetical protein
MLRVAVPFAPTVALPRVLAPLENVTAPDGADTPAVTLITAVRATEPPAIPGFGTADTDVAVCA